jgi:uncharacterized protein YndB with AHSA1/START domain
MAKTKTLTFQRTVNAPAPEVYRAFTNSTVLREWLSDVALATPEKGGRLYLGWNTGYYAAGEFTSLTPNKKVAFTWHGRGEPAATGVQVTLKEKNGATLVTVAHSVGAGSAWAKATKEFTRGWEDGLENLQSVLETGHDLRFTLRPMLGVMVDNDIDAERAPKYGVPVNYGVRLGSAIDGMGAQAAGLQGGDVIVGVGGKKVTNFNSLSAALQPHRAGQTVKVIYYRAGEKETTNMELSRRPLPEVPATAAELADYVRRLYADVDKRLAECFNGVSEEAANHKPAPDEWSAKEVIAHILSDERDSHGFITELVRGNERAYDGGFENSHLRTRVVAESYPTMSEMLADLTRMEAETAALLAGLPPEFVARKGSFWRVAYNYTQASPHYDDHIRQIEAALESARQPA